MLAAFGITAALYVRSRTGMGQRVDTSLLQASLGLMPEALALFRQCGMALDRFSRAKIAQIYLFRCIDEQTIVVHLSSPSKFWEAFARALGRDDMTRDPRFRDRADRIRNYDQIRSELAPIFRLRSRADWLARLNEAAVPCAPFHTIDQVLSDPLVCDVLDTVGPRGDFINSPVTFSSQGQRPVMPAPSLGQHTDEILSRLGYGSDKIRRLHALGVI
jgi:formyl-CoA transferase